MEVGGTTVAGGAVSSGDGCEQGEESQWSVVSGQWSVILGAFMEFAGALVGNATA